MQNLASAQQSLLQVCMRAWEEEEEAGALRSQRARKKKRAARALRFFWRSLLRVR